MNETSHTGFEASAAAYALGALDLDERREFEAHLSTCARCQADVSAYRQVTAGIGAAIDPVQPPASLKARVLAHATGAVDDNTRARAVTAGPEATPARRAGISAAWLATAASLAIAIGMGMYAWSLRTQVDVLQRMTVESNAQAQRLRAELAAVRSDSGRLVRTVNVLASPDLLRVDLAGTPGTTSATGRAFWSRSRGLLFTADRLPALGAGRIYQIWLVLPKQPPINAGLLTVDNAGSGTTLGALPSTLDVPRSTNVTVAVTNEPAAGSPGPTTPILLAGSARTE
jgi:anti-sigma-K factor RskA